MTDGFFDRIVAELRIRMVAAGQDPDVLAPDGDRRRLALALANGARFTIGEPGPLSLGREPSQIAAAVYEQYFRVHLPDI